MITLTMNGANIPDGYEVELYWSVDAGFDPYVGEGEMIGSDLVEYDHCDEDPEVVAFLVDGCSSFDHESEYIIVETGGGFFVDDLVITLPSQNIIFSTDNESLGSPCSWTEGDGSQLSGCSNIIDVGPGDFVPANSILFVQTTDGFDQDVDVSGLCGNNGCIYVLKNGCTRTVGAFSNGSSNGIRIYEIDFGCSSQTLEYDTDDINFGNGTYVDEDGIAAPSDCISSPPGTITSFSIDSDIGNVNHTVPNDWCNSNDVIYVKAIINSNDIDGQCCEEILSNEVAITVTCPEAMSAGPLEVIDNGDGTGTFDLTILDITISDGVGTVEWYADAGLTQPISIPSDYTSIPTMVYAVVTINGCSSDPEEVELIIINVPEGCIGGDLDVCESGCATFTFEFSGGTGSYDVEYELEFLGQGFGPFTLPGISDSFKFDICFDPDIIFPQFDTGSITLPTCVLIIFCLEEGDEISLNLLSITDSNTGVVGTIGAGCNQTITFHPDPVIDGDVIDTCPGVSDGEIDLDITTGTAPFDFEWDNGESTEIITGLDVGTYEVIVTDDNGCSSTEDFTVDELAAMIINLDSEAETCQGLDDGTIDVMVSDGQPPYNFDWSDNIYDGMDMLANVPSGTYTVTITDDAGCSSVESIIVDPGAIPTPSMFNVTTEYCINEFVPELSSISDNGIPGTWSPSVSIDTDDVGTTDYTFTPDPDECADPLVLTIEIFDKPEISIDDIVCSGDNYAFEITLNGDPNTNYNLNGSAVVAPNPSSLTTDASGEVVIIFEVPLINGSTTISAVSTTSPFCDSFIEMIDLPDCECPTITTSPLAQTICDGDIPDLSIGTTGITYDDPNGFAGNIVWTLDNIDPSQGGVIYNNTSFSNGTCNLVTEVLYGWLECQVSNSPLSYEATGELNITVNPGQPSMVVSTLVNDACSSEANVISYQILAADGTLCDEQFIDAGINNTCFPMLITETIDFTIVDIEALFGTINNSCNNYVPLSKSGSFMVFPSGFTVSVTGENQCGELSAELFALDGSACNQISQPCVDENTTLSYDFESSLTFTPLSECPYSELSGTISCGSCVCSDPVLVEAGTPISICPEPNTIIDLTTIGASISGSATDGLWSGGTGSFDSNVFSSATTYTISQSDIDAGSITLTLTSDIPGDATCLIETDQLLISFLQTIELDVIVTDENCSNSNDGTIEISLFNPVMPITYDWSEDSLDGMSSVQDVSPGNYTLTVTDGNGCTQDTSIDIGVGLSPIATITNVQCSGTDYVFELIVIGLPNTIYELTGSATITPSNPSTVTTDNSGQGNLSFVIPLSDGSTTLQVLSTSSPVCASEIIPIIPPVCDCPIVTPASLSQTICSGMVVDLSQAATGYSINDPNGVSGNVIWTTDNNSPDQGGSAYANDGEVNGSCNVSTLTLFGWLECLIPDSPTSYVSLGSIDISINPGQPTLNLILLVSEICSGQPEVMKYEIISADGTLCAEVPVDGRINETCSPQDITIEIEITPEEIADLYGVTNNVCSNYQTLLESDSYTVYPASLNVLTSGDGLCSVLIAQLFADNGTLCMEVTQNCNTNSDEFFYDFESTLDFTPLSDCGYENLSGTLNCGACDCDNPVILDAGNDQTICAEEGAMIQLSSLGSTISGGVTNGLWSGGSGTFDSNVFDEAVTYLVDQQDIDAGSITLTLTSDTPSNPDCDVASDQVMITFIISAEPLIIEEIYCSGDGNMYISPSGTIYDESFPSGTETIDDPNGCPFNVDVSLEFLELPTLNVVSMSCSADQSTYTIEYTSEGIIELVSVGVVTANSIENIPSGVPIEITISNNGMCTEVITIPAPNCDCPMIPPPISSGDRETCEGFPIPDLTVAIEPGTTAEWYSDPSLQTLVNLDETFSATIAGTYYVIAVDNDSNCPSTAIEVNLRIIENPEVEFIDVNCSDDQQTYVVEYLLTTDDPVNYTTNMGDVNVLTNGTFTIANIPQGQSALITITTIEGECMTIINTESPDCVCPNPLSADFIFPQSVCEGNLIPLSVININGFNEFEWSSTGDGTFNNTITEDVLYVPGDTDIASNQVVIVFVSSDTGGNEACVILEATLTIAINPIPQIPFVTANIQYCVGDIPDPINVNGENLTWFDQDGNMLSDTPEINTSVSGVTQYSITQTVDGCTSLPAELSILIQEEIVIDFEAEGNCVGSDFGEITITNLSGGSGVYVLEILGQSISLTDADIPFTIEYPLDTSIMFDIRDDNVCTTSINSPDTIPTISDEELTIIPISIDLNMYDLSFETGLSSSVLNIEWSSSQDLSCTDCPNPRVGLADSTTIFLVIETVEGCILSSELFIPFADDLIDIFIPNIFSPTNDEFLFPQSSNNDVLVSTYQIYDRWGNLVYMMEGGRVNDPTLSWDGTSNGSTVEQGVYVYFIELEMPDGTTRMFAGDVTLIR